MLRPTFRVLPFATLVLCASVASAQTTIQVNIGATPAASGSNLLTALAAIVDNSASKPYVVKVHPGVYDVGATPLQMKPYVDIEGSGQASTIVQGSGNNGGGLVAVVQGASHAELRQLQVVSLGSGFGYSIAVLLNNVDTSVRDVSLVSRSATSNWGLRNLASSSSVQDVTIAVNGGSTAYGIANTGASVISTPSIRRAVISVAGSTQGNGIYSDQNANPFIRDVEVKVTSCPTGYGIRYAYGADPGFAQEVANSRIAVSGGSTVNVGIEGSGSSFVATLAGSLVSAFAPALGGGTAYGIRYSGSSPGVVFLVDHCDVTGASALFTLTAVSAPTAAVRIGASKMVGVVNAGAATCAAAFNSNYVPLSAGCL